MKEHDISPNIEPFKGNHSPWYGLSKFLQKSLKDNIEYLPTEFEYDIML